MIHGAFMTEQRKLVHGEKTTCCVHIGCLAANAASNQKITDQKSERADEIGNE